MSDINYKMVIESILFATGSGVSIDKLSKILDCDIEQIREFLDELQKDYIENNRGIRLFYAEDNVQLGSNPEYFPYITKLLQKRKNDKLSSVALETLAIIAYKQPVTKAEIESIRGVKSDYAVNQLIDFNLVKEVGRSKAPGHPLLFGTTKEFLLGFGIKSIEELPRPDTSQIKIFFNEAAQELNYFPEDEDMEVFEI